MSHKNPISSSVFADGPITRVVGGGIHPDQTKDSETFCQDPLSKCKKSPQKISNMTNLTTLTALSELFGELLATLKVNTLRGTILVNGGGIEELEKFLETFEERFRPFKPKNIFRTATSATTDWGELKF